MSNEAVIITAAKDQIKKGLADAVPGSIEDKCARCGTVIVLSPSSQNVMKQMPGVTFETLCTICGTALMNKGPCVVTTAPGAEEEYRELERQDKERN